MNATKRLLTGAAIAAGVLGIWAGAFFAYQQELSPGAERRPGDAEYDDGVYIFYFKNGSSIKKTATGTIQNRTERQLFMNIGRAILIGGKNCSRKLEQIPKCTKRRGLHSIAGRVLIQVY